MKSWQPSTKPGQRQSLWNYQGPLKEILCHGFFEDLESSLRARLMITARKENSNLFGFTQCGFDNRIVNPITFLPELLKWKGDVRKQVFPFILWMICPVADAVRAEGSHFPIAGRASRVPVFRGRRDAQNYGPVDSTPAELHPFLHAGA